MKRTIGMILGAAMAAGILAGCVDGRYGRYRDDRGYYDDRDRHDDRRHGYRDDRDDDRQPTIVCASQDGRRARCRTDFRIKRAEVDKRYSKSRCEYGRSWGYDANEVWVDGGCRARFRLTPAGYWR